MSEDTPKPPSPEVQRDAKGRWIVPPKSPGRPVGSRNNLSEDFLTVLYQDFKENGKEAVAACRKEDPSGYVKVIASILPKELNVKIDAFEEMADDELIQRIQDLDRALSAALGRANQAQDGVEAPSGDAEVTILPPLH